MKRLMPEGTQFFSLDAFQDQYIQSNQEGCSIANNQDKGKSKYYDTTIGTNFHNEKDCWKIESTPNEKVDDSCFQDFQDFIKRMPKQLQADVDNLNMSSQFTMAKQAKIQIGSSVLIQKQKFVAQTNWLSQLELRCIIDYNNKKINTICRIRDSEMQFQNGGRSFLINNITKMKVMFENYQKCLCFTYDDSKGKKNIETKFKIFVQNDIKDDLYLLFSKIIIQKAILLEFEVDLKQGQDLDVDKFIMTGQIYKLSQIMHHWKLRKIVLTDRIQSFKDDKCTFSMKNIKQIWTRFQMYEQNLIIKIRHGKQKTELALPLVNYPVKFCKNNWLYRIYRLLSTANP